MVASPETKDFRVLVDFDWTLFDTTSFGNDLWNMIAKETALMPEAIEKDMKTFEADARLGGYSFEDHILSYGLDSKQMWTKLDQMLRSGDFLYADSSDFIAKLRQNGFDPSILTFGETRFQTAKVVPFLGKLVANDPSRRAIAYDVMFQKKGEYIEEHYPGERGVLVDDVPEQELPEGFTEIHLDRGLWLAEPQQKAGGFVVSNLAQAFQVIQELEQEA